MKPSTLLLPVVAMAMSRCCAAQSKFEAELRSKFTKNSSTAEIAVATVSTPALKFAAINGLNPKTVRVLNDVASNAPAESDTSAKAKFGDFVRIGGGLLYTRDLGVKALTLAQFYFEPMTKAKTVADQSVAADLADLRDATNLILQDTKKDESKFDYNSLRQGLAFLEKARERNVKTVGASLRTTQNGETNTTLSPASRFSLVYGFGSETNNKHFIGCNYTFNDYVGITLGFALAGDAASKGRLSIGFSLDPGLVTQLFNQKTDSTQKPASTGE